MISASRRGWAAARTAPHLVAGFNNRQLTDLVATLLDAPHTHRQATYDLRRPASSACLGQRAS